MNKSGAIAAGINAGLLYQWVKRYRIEGYEGLVAMKKGRPLKETAELTPSEREEMLRLKAENEYPRAENVVIKRDRIERRKMGGATQERKHCASRNSEKKDVR